MTTVYYKSIDCYLDLHGSEFLSPARQAKGDSLKSIDDKARNLVAGLLLHHVFGEKAWDIQEEEKGKPYLDGHHFNLSHSGNFVVLAVSDQEVGVDIQAPRTYKPGLVRWFSPEEQTWLQSGGDFHRLWTGKEALSKAIGTGLTKALLKTNILSGQWNDFSLSWHELEGYTMCVATKSTVITTIPL